VLIVVIATEVVEMWWGIQSVVPSKSFRVSSLIEQWVMGPAAKAELVNVRVAADGLLVDVMHVRQVAAHRAARKVQPRSWECNTIRCPGVAIGFVLPNSPKARAHSVARTAPVKLRSSAVSRLRVGRSMRVNS
jgi:hypothetical protein